MKFIAATVLLYIKLNETLCVGRLSLKIPVLNGVVCDQMIIFLFYVVRSLKWKSY